MTIINMAGGKPAKPIVVEAVEDTPSTLPHTYVPGEGVDYLSSVTVGKDPNLVPGNVKKDVTIFGTVGTLESGGGGDCSDIFTVTGLSILGGYLGMLGLRVSDTAVSVGEAFSGGYESAYVRTQVERIYASEAGGWILYTANNRSLGSTHFEFTLPEVVGGPRTIPLASLKSDSPWRHVGPFTARGSWVHGNVAEDGNVQISVDPSELYYMELSCDGTNLTFDCPTLSSVSLKVGGYSSGANTNAYSAIYPNIVEVHPL